MVIAEMMIETDNLTKRFRCSAGAWQAGAAGGGSRARRYDAQWFTAVDGITLAVPAGEILALLGPNGAGKTTTIRMLGSILKPSEGWARVAGLDTVRQSRQVRQAVGLLTEFPGLYLRMRGDEYLAFFGQLQGLSDDQTRDRIEALTERFGLADVRRRRIAEYSKGMRQKLALIRAMLHDPPLLLLDEPTSAMDPHSAKLVRDAIVELRDDRRTIVLCTHNLMEAEQLADRIAFIRRGQIVALDTPSRLKAKLLGPPLLELRLAQALDGRINAAAVADLIQVEAQGDSWLRYRTASPQTTNPALLARLAELGAPVVSLSEVARSLEDVYLQIVAGSEE